MVQILKEKVLSITNSGSWVKKIKSGQSVFPIDGQRWICPNSAVANVCYGSLPFKQTHKGTNVSQSMPGMV